MTLRRDSRGPVGLFGAVMRLPGDSRVQRGRPFGVAMSFRRGARVPLTLLAGAMILAGVNGCGSSQASEVEASPKTITVFAAASLTEPFTLLGKQFESANPGTKVNFSFGPSSGLAVQITSGAPADVFAAASSATMQQVVQAGAARNPLTFARNSMAVAVPPGNPARIEALEDLVRPGVKVAVCQAQVPCGSTAAQVLANAKITVNPATYEADVKGVLSKVELGEVDAGIVYVTDVRTAGPKVSGIKVAEAVNATTIYPIAAITSSHQSALAQSFVLFVGSSAGQIALSDAGFAKP